MLLDPEAIILNIELEVTVAGTEETLDIPVPYAYDGPEMLELLMEDVLPCEDAEFDSGSLDGAVSYDEVSGLVEVSGQMDPQAFEDWRERASDLREIGWEADELDERGLTPGEWFGIDDLRTGEPSLNMLDETIEHDLANAEVLAGGRKAEFRAMREASGASQAALAEALGVNARTVKRWETPGQPEPPRDAWRLVEGWKHDAVAGAHWHVHQAESLREDFHEAYVLVLFRSQEELDRALAPLLAQAPSYRWQDALAEAKARSREEAGQDSPLEIEHDYTNFPGTRSYWRANAAVRLAAAIMDERKIPYGFAYAGELDGGLGGTSVWVPRADVQRIEGANGTMVVCGMR